MLELFAALGASLSSPGEITLAGGSALALTGVLVRATEDGDVVASEPRLDQMAEAIEIVASTFGLPAKWLNDSVQQFANILPADYPLRRVSIGTFGHLTVFALGRLDLILMKVIALRGQDQEDLKALRPTGEEWEWATAHFVRLAMIGYEKKVVRARHFIAGRPVKPTGEGAS